ncbi:PIH1 domain-containing protein 1 [Dinochytrium kinnereticum]|nr:PIH1 domain-containing protein 1 [Dinochytrium kinnereticum]
MESLLKDLRARTDEEAVSDAPFPGFGGGGKDELDDVAMAALLDEMSKNPEAAASLLQSLVAMEGMTKDGKSAESDDASAGAPKIAPGMMEIVPDPGFVFKTRLAEATGNWKKGMKVFVNVCHHEVIPPPPDASLEEISQAAAEGNHAAFKMPLSLAGPTVDKDKGALCLVFEACISPTSVAKAQQDQAFITWVAMLCFEWLEEKHKILLEREYTLPKMKAKGKLSTHVIRKSVKPKITEMLKKSPETKITSIKVAPTASFASPVVSRVDAPSLSKQATSKPESSELRPQIKGNNIPQYSVELRPISKPREVIVTVKLNDVPSPSQAALLQIESAKLFLLPNNSASTTSPYPYDPLEIDIPISLDVDGDVDASFDRSTRTLTVVIPIASMAA